jgi:hypothetical protein
VVWGRSESCGDGRDCCGEVGCFQEEEEEEGEAVAMGSCLVVRHRADVRGSHKSGARGNGQVMPRKGGREVGEMAPNSVGRIAA